MADLPISAAGAASDELAQVLSALFGRLHRQIPREVSLTASSTMGRLADLGPLRVTALAEMQGVTQPSMTSLVIALEKAGSVHRRSDPDDGRAILVELTDRGRAEVASRRRRQGEYVAAHIAALPADQRQKLSAAVPALRMLEASMTEESL